MGAMLAPYKGYLMEEVLSPIRWLQFLELLLWGPNEDPFRFFRILDEATKAARRGDIAVLPPRLRVLRVCNQRYSSLWETLERISNGRIYDSNIKFYHERKKVAICGLDEWVREKKAEIERRINRNIKIIQCKLRFLLEPEKEPEKQNSRYDFTIKRFLIVPIVNFQIDNLENKDGEKYPSLIDEVSSELVQNLIDKFLLV